MSQRLIMSWKQFEALLDFIVEGRRLHDENIGYYKTMSKHQKYLDGGDCMRRAIKMKTISLIASDRLDDIIEQEKQNDSSTIVE